MITKLDLVVGLSVDDKEVLFKKSFQNEQIDNTLKPYQCFSEKRVVEVDGKSYTVDFSFVIKELE